MIVNLFSKRQRALRGETPDVYQYTELPNSLRVQTVQILQEVLPRFHRGDLPEGFFVELRRILRRERGAFCLLPGWTVRAEPAAEQEVLGYFLSEKDVELALDVVELAAHLLVVLDEQFSKSFTSASLPGQEAIQEVNYRLREHGVGFQVEGSVVMRNDSQFLHGEIVKPAIAILHDKKLAGANEEFLRAHEHYRHGRHEECLVDCLKAFESVMKAIAKQRRWPYGEGDSAKKLIEICLDHRLVPTDLQSDLASLRSLLESGIPTIRNRNAGHGQGATPRRVPEHLVRFCLNQTAATIVFLAECNGTLG